MSQRPRPLRQNSAGTQLYGPAGAAVWNAPTLDLEKRRLYATSGTCYISEFFEDPVGFDDNTCVSVMAFDLDSGERLWWTQLVPVDRHGGGCGMTAEERRINCPGFVDDGDDDPSGSPVQLPGSLLRWQNGCTCFLLHLFKGYTRRKFDDPESIRCDINHGEVGEYAGNDTNTR